ncbi:MAG: DUF4345 domain-containing protein [Fibrobacterales bacterium]
MKYSKILNSFLIITGLIAAGIGAGLLCIPVEFEASADVILSNDVNLLSELRATGGGLFASGILIVLGAFIRRLAFTSVIISTVLYLAYGIGRIIGMILDGIPSEGLVQATVLEIGIGVTGVFIFLKYIERD